ncbi:DgyrCDS7536 [Dimorphilus gyrociliatus]|uniref:DgyrCDS7536 n=1 Tax=Dimorphilus gyrociliatus TaxID=2664684 RepID=A0A7I8VTW5_9ANNE|nr:DgyrCDS7536 [Dimorphilus gyrociliatus]
MGSFVSKAMNENFEKMQAAQETMLQRQIQMQNYMRERQMAMQLARAREMFYWLSSFYGICSVGMLAGFMKTKKPAAIAPFIPLTFLVAYQYDLCFGSKMYRIREEAEKILENEKTSLYLPGDGLPTVKTLDNLRSIDYRSSNK